MAEDETPQTGSDGVDRFIAQYGDWRGDLLAEARRLIHEAEPEVAEEMKWQKKTNPRGVPVWSRGGIICTGEAYKDKVKFTFMRGASLEDPEGVFNASLDGNARRAIDLAEGDRLEPRAFKALIAAAARANGA